MGKTVYVDGMRVFPPNDKAPDFVLGTLLITVNDLVKFAKANKEYMRDYNGDKQLPCQIRESRDGGMSITLDTYRPDGNKNGDSGGSEDSEGLPF